MSEQTTPETEGGEEEVGQVTGMSSQELAAEGGEEIPDREAMSLVNANLALPINAAIAANVLSDNANANAGALQQTPISQGN
ncbi:MAG: hypothetical protein QOK05_2683 [Chloroflexota bacterium]|jgi:hypothetical protein|nr:hypothetical protein [Chloroflexota bacterium]